MLRHRVKMSKMSIHVNALIVVKNVCIFQTLIFEHVF